MTKRERHIWLCADDYGISPAVNAGIRELILRYGTPAERLGSGPAFRLRRAEPAGPAVNRTKGRRQASETVGQ